MCGVVLSISMFGIAFANPYKTGDIVVNGAKVQFDNTMGKPVIIEGRTHVPIRIMADSLGYVTGWDQATKTATVKGEGSTIELKINSPRAKINGKDAYIDVREDGKPVLSTTASVRDGRTYVPLRFVTETLGCTVEFKGGVTYINNGKAPIDTNKFFKEMPDIPGTATYNWEKDRAILINYFGDNRSSNLACDYTVRGKDFFYVYEDKELNTIEIGISGWYTDNYNDPKFYFPEYAEARGTFYEVLEFFLPKGADKLYDVIDNGLNGRITNEKLYNGSDISSYIGSDGKKVSLIENSVGNSAIRIQK